MGLLFVAGVMNLFWMVGIAVFVMVEKAAPNGDLIARIAGGTLIVAGVALIAG
jgi:predicted metal-binding membrane protein